MNFLKRILKLGKMQDKKCVILLLGVQRSGTNAIRRSLENDKLILSINESISNDFFKDWLLKPKSEYENKINGLHNVTLLLKPVQETRKRNIISIMNDFSEYKTTILWPFRNPINVYYSQKIKKDRSVYEFLNDWINRNSDAIKYSENNNNIIFIPYEKLINDKEYFASLCVKINVNGKFMFKQDSKKGELNLNNKIKNEITKRTQEIYSKLYDLS